MTRFSECLRRGRGRLHCDGWNNVDAYFTFETLGPYLSLMLGMCTGLISPVKRSPLESPDDSLQLTHILHLTLKTLSESFSLRRWNINSWLRLEFDLWRADASFKIEHFHSFSSHKRDHNWKHIWCGGHRIIGRDCLMCCHVGIFFPLSEAEALWKRVESVFDLKINNWRFFARNSLNICNIQSKYEM